MAKPVTLPLWATDTTNTTIGAVENGLTVKLEPSTGVKQQGWIAGEEAPARWMNWLLNNIYTWAVYLDGLATDAQFLANNFAFTGDPTFSGAVSFNGGAVDFFDAPVLHAVDILYNVPLSRVKMAHLPHSGNWQRDATGALNCTSGPGLFALIELPMPQYASLTAVSAVVYEGSGTATVGTKVGVYLEAPQVNAVNIRTLQGSVATHTLAAGIETLTPVFSAFEPAAGERAVVRIESSNPGTLDQLLRVTYTYSQPRATGA